MAICVPSDPLEPQARQFVEATSEPPYLFHLGPEKGRETVDQVQSGYIDKPAESGSYLRPAAAQQCRRSPRGGCARVAHRSRTAS
jgi:hypothetical protein